MTLQAAIWNAISPATVPSGRASAALASSAKPDGLTYSPALAAMFIYLNRTGYNGLFRLNSGGAFNVPAGRYEKPRICDEHNLLRVSAALAGEGITLRRRRFEALVDEAEAGDFLYFDPPYAPVSKTARFTSYTAEGFDLDDQKTLRDVIVTLAGCSNPPDDQRLAAEWVISTGGKVGVNSQGQQSVATRNRDLPKGPFVIESIAWEIYPGDENSRVTDEDLLRLSKLTELRDLDLWAVRVTDKGIDALLLAATPSSLKRLLDATLERGVKVIGGAGAVHFAGHGLFNAADPDSSVMYLSDGTGVVSSLFNSAKYGTPLQPLIFFNACMIGMGGELLGNAGGFPGNCLRGGFGGVLGALWEVDDAVAAQIAAAFWERALPKDRSKAEPVAQVLRDLRTQYTADPSTLPVSTYLSYVFYGHPRLTLQ